MNDEAIYILTKLICKNYKKYRGKYIKLTYEELKEHGCFANILGK